MKKIGLLIPSTNLTIEYEFQNLIRDNIFQDVILYVNRIPYQTSYKEDKEQFLKELAENSELKLKELEYLKLDYYAFFCTSSSIMNKEKIIANNPSEALIESANVLNINQCLLITPYDEIIGGNVKKYLENNDINVIKEVHLNLLNTAEYFEYGINKLEKLVIDKYKPEYKNIIISCTNFPTINIVKLEESLNTQIISSNLSMFWKICNDNNLKTKIISKLFDKLEVE